MTDYSPSQLIFCEMEQVIRVYSVERVLGHHGKATLDPLARAEALMIGDLGGRLEHAFSQLSAQEGPQSDQKPTPNRPTSYPKISRV